MRKYIEASSKANEIRMLLNHPSHKNKLFLVLEGRTDLRLFRSLIKSDCISIESVDGKLDLIKVVNSLREGGNDKVLGICDADFDHINNLVEDRENGGVYVTDVHDAEIMLFNSPALESFIDEFSEQENYQELHDNLKESVFSACYKIGLLRLINNNHKLNLCWKGINFNSFVDVKKLSITINVDSLIDDLFRRSPNVKEGVTKSSVQEMYNELNSNDYCKLQICCGHDVCNIVSMVYSQKWASTVRNINKDKVESSLRVGFTLDHFKSTELYGKLIGAIQGLGFGIQDASNCIQPTYLRSADFVLE